MSSSIGGINFPFECVWTNEHGESNVSHNSKNALDGTLRIQSFTRKKGLSIIIDAQWLTSADVYDLQALVNTDAQMVLTLTDARQFNVMFDQNNTPLEVEALAPCADRTIDPSREWEVTLNLIEI